MWLLDVHTVQLIHFQDDRQLVGKYAILSHTWEDDEVSFQDVRSVGARNKEGFEKIQYTCRQAIDDGLEYAWVDTCCINKDSSAELSEAINSMWRWYWNSAVCYAYLSDMREPLRLDAFPAQTSNMAHCRWFTRGWTIQELLAPKIVRFYNRDWEYLGDRDHLADLLQTITQIADAVLKNRSNIFRASVAARFSWAAHRNTTRVEDEAYALLGLFGVNMPLLYGEGTRAFERLQEEIIRTSNDDSILAWTPWKPQQCGMLLAPRPYGFRKSAELHRRTTPRYLDGLSLTHRELKCTLITKIGANGEPWGVLECSPGMGAQVLRLRSVLSRSTRDVSKTRPVYEVVRAMKNNDDGYQHSPVDLKLGQDVLLLRNCESYQVFLEAMTPKLDFAALPPGLHWKVDGRQYSLCTIKENNYKCVEIVNRDTGRRKPLGFGLDYGSKELLVGWCDYGEDVTDVEPVLRDQLHKCGAQKATWLCKRPVLSSITANATPFEGEDIPYRPDLNRGWHIKISMDDRTAQ